jgi:hypothetical protein
MTRTDDTYDRRTYLQATTAAVVGAVGVTGCLGLSDDGGDGGSGGETGTLATQVTDDPGDIEDFQSCVVTIVGYWLGPAPDGEGTVGGDGTTAADDGTATESDDGTATLSEGTPPEDVDGEREYHELDEPAEADLVKLQDGATQLLAEDELATGEHAFLQLDTDGVDATLNDGSEPTVDFPGEAPVTFNEAFEIRADTRTTFTADFTPVKRGRTGKYVIQPVPSGIEVVYEAVEDDGTAEDGTASEGDSTATGDGTTDGTATEA